MTGEEATRLTELLTPVLVAEVARLREALSESGR